MRPHHLHVALLVRRCGGIESVLLFTFDHLDGLFAGVTPLFFLVTHMSDMLMRAIVVRLVDTSNVMFSHMFVFVNIFR